MIFLLYHLWLTAQAMDALASILGSWYLIRLRQEFGYYVAAVFICTSLEALIAATSLYIFWTDDVRVSIPFVILRIAGRLIKAAALWVFVLYCLGYLKGDRGRGLKKDEARV